MLTNRYMRGYVMQKPTVFFGEPMRYGQAFGCFGFMVLFMLLSFVAVGVTWNLFQKKREKAKNHCHQAEHQPHDGNNHGHPTVFVMELQKVNIE